MPVKNWSDGDYVYGTDLDFLTGSVVMRFATAAARTSALVGDLAPTPGMISFTSDDQIWWQYVVVSATGYWVPQPGTTVCSVYQTAAQTSVATGTPTVITMTGVYKNLPLGSPATAPWASNRFTPKVPGWYLLSGGCGWAANANASYRTAYFRANGNTDIVGSSNQLHTSANFASTVLPRPVSVYLNGTTNYVELMSMQGTGGPLDTSVAGAIAANFNAVYSGPALP